MHSCNAYNTFVMGSKASTRDVIKQINIHFAMLK